MDPQPNIDDIRSELLELGFELNQINQALALTTDKEKLVELLFQFQEDQAKQSKVTNPTATTDLSQVNLLTDLQLLGIIKPPASKPTNTVDSTNPAGEEEWEDEDDEDDDEEDDGFYKMVFLVRMDLKMGAGKVASQTGHAVLGAFKQLEDRVDEEPAVERIMNGWENCGTAKIVLKVDSKEEMLDLEKKAADAGINTYLVCDAGKTEVEPGSITVCAIGPDRAEKIDMITKHLKLLK